MCCECNNYAARWKCNQCLDCFCSVCYGLIHKKGKRRSHTPTLLRYYTIDMAKLEEERITKYLDEKREEKEKFEENKKLSEQQYESSALYLFYKLFNYLIILRKLKKYIVDLEIVKKLERLNYKLRN